ncbi:butyrophilin-like protein 8 isoform X2 [Carettochelys insculpta]|uniref:butyrophilin-like protein 8 isoform X2 n=1 Tax=Carettochelys insculpta TaxID=44489 RepID=UPI003EBD9D94
MERKKQLVSWLFYATLLSVTPFSESFEVLSPRTVMGIVGQDVVFPCQISTRTQPDNMEVQWKKIIQAEIETVCEYSAQTGQDVPGQKYQSRAVFLKDGFSFGNVSLKLKNVRPADEGMYSCIVKSNEWSADTAMDLKIAAVASVSIDVLGPRDRGIGLACRSAGWFPEPELQWVTKNGQQLQAVSKTEQDREHLFNVLSYVTVPGEETGEIRCTMQNSRLKTEQKSIILLSAKQKKTTKEQELSQRDIQTKGLDAECHDLRQSLDRAVAELDFRKARSYMVPVTLDPSYKHPELTMSEDGKTVQHSRPSSVPAAPSGTLIAVGREGFVASRYHGGEGKVCRWYWEVEVWRSPNWELGVLSETVRNRVRKERLDRLPEEGCWALGSSDGQFHSSKANAEIQSLGVKPTVIGLYLDLEAKSLLFYSVNSMALILEVPVEPSEKLFPFLSPHHATEGAQGQPLIICPPSDWDFPQKLPNESISKADTSSAQSSAPKNGEGAGNKRRPPATAVTTQTAPKQASSTHDGKEPGKDTGPSKTGETSTATAQPSGSSNEEEAGNNTGSSITEETTLLPEHQEAPADQKPNRNCTFESNKSPTRSSFQNREKEEKTEEELLHVKVENKTENPGGLTAFFRRVFWWNSEK